MMNRYSVSAPLGVFLICTVSLSWFSVDRLCGQTNSSSSPVEQQDVEQVPPIINAQQLHQMLNDDSIKLCVLEPGRNKNRYDDGHIPQAQFLHWVRDMTDPKEAEFYNNITAKQFVELVQGLGIQNDTHVVIYDRLASRLSMRLFWTFKFYGHQKVQILDGGINIWKKSYPTTQDVPVVSPSNYQRRSVHPELLADMGFVKQRLEDKNTKFVDGRPFEQYAGHEPGRVFHTKKAHDRLGHIPKSVNVFWQDNFNKDGTLKSASELRELYAKAGIEADNCVVTYCNEGLHAAPPWFVLTQVLKYKNVQLYDSSMAEWAKSKNPMDKMPPKEKLPNDDNNEPPR